MAQLSIISCRFIVIAGNGTFEIGADSMPVWTGASLSSWIDLRHIVNARVRATENRESRDVL